jgi:hypothetical protein
LSIPVRWSRTTPAHGGRRGVLTAETYLVGGGP